MTSQSFRAPIGRGSPSLYRYLYSEDYACPRRPSLPHPKVNNSPFLDNAPEWIPPAKTSLNSDFSVKFT